MRRLLWLLGFMQSMWAFSLPSLNASRAGFTPPVLPDGGKGTSFGFWHIFGGSEVDFRPIVLRQMDYISTTGLLNAINHIFYNTLGGEHVIGDMADFANRYYYSSSKFSHISHHSKGWETLTLTHLYDFCQVNPNSKVLYFHDKGSFHKISISEEKQLQFAKYLNCFVLNTHCLKALDDFDVCGMRFSPIPSPHYSGNYWWATCAYVNRLIRPDSHRWNATFNTAMEHFKGNSYIGTDRFFSEMWIASAPNVKPADCMPTSPNSVDNYLFSSKFTNEITLLYSPMCNISRSLKRKMRQQKPLPRHKLRMQIGSTCGKARIMSEVSNFTEFFHRRPKEHYVEYLANLTTRSYLWYGQPPETMTEIFSMCLKNVEHTNWTAVIKLTDRKSLMRSIRDASLNKFNGGQWKPKTAKHFNAESTLLQLRSPEEAQKN